MKKAARRRDRRHFAAIVLGYVLGLACLACRHVDFGLPVAGLIFIGLATVELVHRARKGPQSPGRHTVD